MFIIQGRTYTAILRAKWRHGSVVGVGKCIVLNCWLKRLDSSRVLCDAILLYIWLRGQWDCEASHRIARTEWRGSEHFRQPEPIITQRKWQLVILKHSIWRLFIVGNSSCTINGHWRTARVRRSESSTWTRSYLSTHTLLDSKKRTVTTGRFSWSR